MGDGTCRKISKQIACLATRRRIVSEVVDITIYGLASKKNRKAPRKGGKGLYLEPKTRLMLERMAMQIPAEYREAKLDNPEAEWWVTYTNGHIDMDGIMTTVLDLLQDAGILVNDNLVHFGNRQIIHPAVRGDCDSVRIKLTPKGA
jgi:Holliday junction resolvase RusA-like endonuclease